jgi:hypothetical protein
MGFLNLLPLIILFVVVGAVAWVGYQVHLPLSPYKPTPTLEIPLPEHPPII